MKMRLLATAALLLWPDIALAQQPQTRPAPGARPERPGPSRPGAGRPGGPGQHPGGPGRPGGSVGPNRPGGPGRPGGNVRPPNPGPGAQPSRPARPPVGQHPGIGQRPPQHRPGAGRPPRFKPIHGPAFRYPRGYSYRRWSIGLLLPSLFLSSSYYFDNYPALGVGPPPPGCRWVRYGPDLLLVDVRTGRIRDVLYGAFY